MPVIYQREKDAIVYQSPDEEILIKKSNDLINQFIKYSKEHELSVDEVRIQRSLLPRIILRVDKREGYFMVFHEQTRINEIKQVALMAYWILKFKPFMINTDDLEKMQKYRRINEGFAAFYLLSAFKQFAVKQGYDVTPMSKHLTDELMYAFTYWDLSKEAVILLSETIGEAFCGVQSQGVPNSESY